MTFGKVLGMVRPSKEKAMETSPDSAYSDFLTVRMVSFCGIPKLDMDTGYAPTIEQLNDPNRDNMKVDWIRPYKTVKAKNEGIQKKLSLINRGRLE